MADNRGHGGGRGRGGGFGFRGGQGGAPFQGRGGGQQGGGRGGSQGGGYRGGGQQGGGRGGGYQGGGHQGGGRGRRGGEFRGGGSRGGRGGNSGADVFSASQGPVVADKTIEELENRWIEQHGIPVTKTSAGQLESKMASLSIKDAVLPFRPRFGELGKPVTLWANYFRLRPAVNSLWRYDLKVTSKRVTEEQAAAAKEKHKWKGKPHQPQSGDGQQEEVKEPKGKKLEKLIKLALTRLNNAVCATEYKQQLITLEKLQLPEGNIIQLDLVEPGRKGETWFVRFVGPKSIDIGGLMTYLQTLDETGHETVFPKFPDEVDALGIVLGHTPRSNPNTAAVGRSRFFAIDDNRKDGVSPYRSLLEILRGYVQSVRPATGRLLLNANVTHGIFRQHGSLAALFEEFGLVTLNQPETLTVEHRQTLEKLHKFLSKARIRCKVPGEEVEIERTMAGLATTRDGTGDNPRPQFQHPNFRFTSPATVEFHLRPPSTPGATPPPGHTFGNMVVVSDYYRARYGINPRIGLPLINVGTTARPIFVLAEHCTLVRGQSVKAKPSPSEADAMIKFACRPPPANAESITTSARQLLELDSNKLLSEFGITVDKDLIAVKGRELAPPTVLYRNLVPVKPENGAWLMMKVKVARAGSPIKNWKVLVIGRATLTAITPHVEKFANFLNNNMGFPINAPTSLHHCQGETEQDLRNAFQAISKPKQGPPPQLVLVVLPRKDTLIYNTVKKLADVDFGLQTVCVQQAMLLQERGQAGYFANVGLKVNLKFGGANHSVEDGTGLTKNTMFVGYDVTHPTNLPAGAGENAPSLIGLVSSRDRELAQWPAVTWETRGRVENVGKGDDKGQKFVGHFKDRIRLWQDHTKQLPENIVIFRDGVSEGQFRMVLDDELPHIREACRQTYAGKKQPRLSLIVSVKRHQTRFYPTDPNHIHPRSKSPKEGTIVDRGVTNVRYWDFFLQAHASLQGTARPAHYTVLLDEIFRSEFGHKAADMLEKLTHEMCYAYGRATKAVSICPPAYYADLVAGRARIHKSELFDDTRSMSSTQQAQVLGRTVHPNLRNTMYYI
ncbi:Piwi-domain-containing protein [Parathielavia appendiculata]|uniref:Piwi-domain-containing protein n=1 Tax=Parathielavia appendiculata TaxID=2587402 RepID=A0AAN6TSF2_9PEZI|nr:Piwi-domain-containing protein [Parathielavia appendiculata]